MTLRIAVLDDAERIARSADWSCLGSGVQVEFFDPGEMTDSRIECLLPFDVICLMRERTALGHGILELLPNLKLVVTTGTRNAAVDLAAARRRGVTVSGTRADPTATAELTFGLIVALARGLIPADRGVREGVWYPKPGMRLSGSVLGILGLGTIGQQVAHYGRAFGMEVIAWSRSLSEQKAIDLGVHRSSIEGVLVQSDYVTLHLVLSETTRGLIGRKELQAMSPSSYLVNTARSGLIDTSALIEALRTRAIAGAALDVFDSEPLPPQDVVLTQQNTILTPHIGYVTRQTLEMYYRDVLEDIAAWLRGQPIRRLA